MTDLTPAEEFVDRVLAEQRAKGRATYGKGLDHRDPLDWRMEALRELADATQYLAAEVLRLQAENEELRDAARERDERD